MTIDGSKPALTVRGPRGIMSITNGDTMTKLISVKVDEGELRKLERSAHKAGISRNAYINKALRFFNRMHDRRLLAEEFRRESVEVRQESVAVLREFERFQNEGL